MTKQMLNLTVITRTYTENDIHDGEISVPWVSDDMPLRDAYKQHMYSVDSADHWPVRSGDRVRWLTGTTEMDYRTGEYTEVSIFIPESVTPPTSLRIARLFGIKVYP